MFAMVDILHVLNGSNSKYVTNPWDWSKYHDTQCYYCRTTKNLTKCCGADCYLSFCDLHDKGDLCRACRSDVLSFQIPQKAPDVFTVTTASKPEKVYANELFRSHLQLDQPVLYLDGPSLGTTAGLLGMGFQPYQLYSANLDPDIVGRLQELGVRAFRGTVGVVLQQLRATGYVINQIWLDYCGTFDGNEFCNPMQDIRRCIQMWKPGFPVTLAVTYCRRVREGQTHIAQRIIDTAALYPWMSEEKWQLKQTTRYCYGSMELDIFKSV